MSKNKSGVVETWSLDPVARTAEHMVERLESPEIDQAITWLDPLVEDSWITIAERLQREGEHIIVELHDIEMEVIWNIE